MRFLLVLLLLPNLAWAQAETREGIYLQNQILQLQRDLEQLRRAGPVAAPAPAPARGGASSEVVSSLLDRVSRLEEDSRSLRGKLDEAEYRNRTLAAQLEKLNGDLDYRMQQLEAGGGRAARQAPAAPSAPPAVTAPPPAAAAAPPRTPERMLAEGQAALGRRDYDAAAELAREVIASRGTPRAYDARFLLAEAEAGQKDWQNAAVAFGEAYRSNPKGSRAPEALVGFGNSLANLGQKKEACDAFALAASQYPKLGGAVKERLDAGRQRAACR
jgi:TolA-binding protein